MKDESIRPIICLTGDLGSQNSENGGKAMFKEILAKNILESKRTFRILSSFYFLK